MRGCVVDDETPFEARVCVLCFVGMVLILAVSALAGWLWPL